MARAATVEAVNKRRLWAGSGRALPPGSRNRARRQRGPPWRATDDRAAQVRTCLRSGRAAPSAPAIARIECPSAQGGAGEDVEEGMTQPEVAGALGVHEATIIYVDELASASESSPERDPEPMCPCKCKTDGPIPRMGHDLGPKRRRAPSLLRRVCLEHRRGRIWNRTHQGGRVLLAMAGTGYGLIGILVIILLVVLIIYFVRRA